MLLAGAETRDNRPNRAQLIEWGRLPRTSRSGTSPSRTMRRSALENDGKLAILPTAARRARGAALEWATHAPTAGTPRFLCAVLLR
jgi:hypothetical protein